MSMSTVAGMFFAGMRNPATPTAECPATAAEMENLAQESDEDNTSCSASEIGCDLSLSASNSNKRNKRKNFKPRNILEYAGSDEEQEHHNAESLHNKFHHHHRQSRRVVVEQQDEEENNEEEDNENAGGEEEDSIPEKVNGVDLSMDMDGMANEEEDSASDDNSEEYNNHTSPVDGPLDLSEVQDYSSKSWQRSNYKDKESVRSLLNNLNNNVSDLPTSFLSQHHPMAAAASGVVPHLGLGLGMGMDLRVSSGGGGASRGQDYEESRSNDTINPSNNNNISTHNNNNHPSAAMLSDFAESTMKELLSLYGITEGQRQAGGKPMSSELLNIHGNLDSSGHHPAKMMLPENMVRLLAAMQESAAGGVGGDHSTQSSQSSVTSTSKTNNNNHPLNFANINSLVQHGGSSGGNVTSGGSPPVRSPSTTNGSYHPGLHNNGTGNGHLFQNKHKSRGLTAFPVIREGLLGKGAGPIDYTRYVRRYANSMECGYQQCQSGSLREHFHCQECTDGTRVFVKKEEMIRHFKWHKKRDESLQHGFMRYSPMDNCSDKFANCTHNSRQTHYHCLNNGCEKVYISTSDVQMHANYHRKDSAILQEGFQRFRASEDCGSDQCAFKNSKTTHFHCRRQNCSFTFKNKADMEKHKSYHIKDEQLNRDGFKKYMKMEDCGYSSCRFSRVCNHIHCIREGCNYVLHSSGQLYSHKRKHERRDAELAYRKYKLAQSLMKGNFGADLSGLNFNDSFPTNKSEEENSRSSFNEGTEGGESEDKMKKFIQICNCDDTQHEHFHCKVDSCLNALLVSMEVAVEHSKNHELEDKIASLAYFTVDPANFDAQDSTIPCISAKCPYQTSEKHYHCLWDGCNEIILVTDEPFKRLEHFKSHQSAPRIEFGDKESQEALDGFFRRKRGRPPKNRVIEVSSGANEAVYTSFKLPKVANIGNGGEGSEDSDSKDPIGFMSYPEGANCNNDSCPYQRLTDQRESLCHYHCGHPRCHFSVSDVHRLSNHLREFHSSCDVVEGFKYFGHSWDCKVKGCSFNGDVDHFHCSRDSFSCAKQSEMMAHETDFHEGRRSGTPSSEDEAGESKSSGQVKSSGTFYPTYSLDKSKITSNGGNAMDLSGSNGPSDSESKPNITDHSLSRILQIPTSDNGETQYGPETACGRPFCKLKRKHHFHCQLCNQAFSELEKLRPHVLKHSNVSPLKPVDSDHSTDEESSKNEQEENQEFKSEQEQQFPKFDLSGMNMPNSNPFPPTSLSNFLGYPGSPSPYLFLQQNPLTSLYAGMMFGGSPGGVFPHGSVIPPPPSMSNNPTAPPHLGGTPPAVMLPTSEPLVFSSSPLQLNNQCIKRPSTASPSSPSSPSEAKKARMQMRILKDEPVPEGYIRFRFNEDCQYVHCGYREHQTHFHCTREDCGYSFCDKTRFVQHTARHERLDTLMGGDFKQFRANVSCGRPDCTYKTSPGTAAGGTSSNKASHFHCEKCSFVCTDTNKVVAHRRQHQKLDSIMAAGFEKFTPSQNCLNGKFKIDSCANLGKSSHYHCLRCGYAVLGLSQMSAHKYRHADC